MFTHECLADAWLSQDQQGRVLLQLHRAGDGGQQLLLYFLQRGPQLQGGCLRAVLCHHEPAGQKGHGVVPELRCCHLLVLLLLCLGLGMRLMLLLPHLLAWAKHGGCVTGGSLHWQGCSSHRSGGFGCLWRVEATAGLDVNSEQLDSVLDSHGTGCLGEFWPFQQDRFESRVTIQFECLDSCGVCGPLCLPLATSCMLESVDATAPAGPTQQE
jgi:hypothetical protein